MSDTFTRHPALLHALVVTLLLIGCGGAQRSAKASAEDAWTCIQRSDKGGAAVLGWASAAPFDEIIRAVDALGHRSGAFPKSSSMRAQAMDELAQGLDRVAPGSRDWLDPARPGHVLFTDVADLKVAHTGLVAILPIRNAALLRSGLVGKDDEARGAHDGFKKAPDGTLFFDVIDERLLVATLSEGRLAQARETITCVADQRPEGLMHLGVRPAEGIKRHEREYNDLRRRAEAEFGRLMRGGAMPGAEMPGGMPGPLGALFQPNMADLGKLYFDWIDRWAHGMASFELGLDATAKQAAVSMVVRPTPGSELAKDFARQKGRHVLEDMRQAPAASIIAGTSHVAPETFQRDMGRILDAIGGFLPLPPPHKAGMTTAMRDVVAAQDGRSGAWLHDHDGLHYTAFLGSAKPATVADGFSRIARHTTLGAIALAQSFTDAAGGGPGGPGAGPGMSAALGGFVAILDAQGWPGVFQMVAGMLSSQGLPTKLLQDTGTGATRCDALDVELPWDGKLAGAPMTGAARTLIGERVQLALCTSRNRYLFGLGPRAVDTLVALGNGGDGGMLDSKPWKGVDQPLDQSSNVFLLNLGEALTWLQRGIPKLQQPDPWPTDDAVAFACQTTAKRSTCTLTAPSALFDIVSRLRTLM